MDTTALENENRQLRHAIDELAFLNELSAAIGASLDCENIMQTIIRKSIRAVKAEQGSITIVSEDKSSEKMTLIRTMVSNVGKKPIGITTLTGNTKFYVSNYADNTISVIYIDK